MTERPFNAVADLLDVRSRLESNGEEILRLRMEVRVGNPEIDEPPGVIRPGRVFIALELDGYEIQPGNRFGEPLKTPVIQEKAVFSELSRSASVSANARLQVEADGRLDASLGAKAATGIKAEMRTETATKSKIEISYVTALGGDQWRIAPPGDQKYLDGSTYISDDDVMCHLRRSDGANRSAVQILGCIKKRDLDFEPLTAKLDLFDLNKKQAIKAFLAKALAASARESGGTLILSEQEISDE